MDRPVIVITGASAGVGRATARAFGERRARVGLLARGRDGLEATKREIEAAGGKAFPSMSPTQSKSRPQRKQWKKISDRSTSGLTMP
jgi:NADP-dependent 3-hydroxy acid dehydrogenase YdfG